MPPTPSTPGLRVVASTDRYVVIDKPAGMLSVPGKGPEKADCAAARVARAYPNATGPIVVHRLDMETSGLLLMALDADAQRELSRQFEQRLVHKEYVGLVSGGLEPGLGAAGEIDLPLRADLERRPVQIVDRLHGRPALTRWRLLALDIDRARLAFAPVTGRTHQIRVHAAHGLGRPLVGDTLYGGEPAERLMLHAAKLSFLDPGSGTRVDAACPPEF